MTRLPDWADTPDAADDHAAMTEDAAEHRRDHQALAADIDTPTTATTTLCICREGEPSPYCWAPAFRQPCRGANGRPGDAA